MRELPKEKILIYAGAVLCVVVAAPLLHRVPRTRGKQPLWHVLFLAGAAATLLWVPESIQKEVFSPGGIVVIGTLLPVYESIVAICSIGTQDDKAWLQYWIASATVSFSTEFMDDITQKLPAAGEHWFEVELLFYLWLLFPLTDGAALIYDCVTKPYIAPVAQRVKIQFEGFMGVFLTVVNTSYIWVLWYAHPYGGRVRAPVIYSACSANSCGYF